MSLFFFDSTSRVYKDTELNKVSEILFSDGVFNTYKSGGDLFTHKEWLEAGDFLVEASGGNMTVTAKPGSATILVPDADGNEQQSIIQEDTELSAQVSANEAIAVRNDAVVLRIDQTVIDGDNLNAAGDNAVSLTVIGGSDADPLTDAEIATALGEDRFVRLANIAVPQSTTEITNSMITDARSLPKMTRATQMASDSFQFYPLTQDPESPESVQVWYNSTEGILKMYNGEKTIALQTQAFDWGYYPPGGVDSQVELEATAENDSDTSVQNEDIQYATFGTKMRQQVFELPNISQPQFRVKLGNPSTPANLRFRTYTINGSNEPDTLVEDITTIDKANLPVNDYVEINTSSDYTPGTKYCLIISSTSLDSNDLDGIIEGEVQTSAYDADDVFLGSRLGSTGSNTEDPTTLTWNSLRANRQFIMQIVDLTEQVIGENDTSGKFYEVAHPFTAKSQDIVGYQVVKGTDVGSPTGFLKASLYRAELDGSPTGNLLTTATITETAWGNVTVGEKAEFELIYDEMTVGTRYVVIIETENNSNTDNYALFFVESTTGESIRKTTSEGWVSAGGDFLSYIITSPIRKIPVTNDQGKIDRNLLPKSLSRVKEYTSDATPTLNIESYEALLITALAEDITSVTVTGLAQDFDQLRVRITASGANRTIAWGSQFEAKGVALDTQVLDGKTLSALFEYDSTTEKWGCIRSVETA